MPRPRRAAAPTSFIEPDIDISGEPFEAEQGADADFLALSSRQRTLIDRAFERGLKAAGKKQRREALKSRKRKRRETVVVDLTGDSGNELAGGSIEDDAGIGEGGFVDAGDDIGGGFVSQDGGGFVNEDDGGFVVDDDEDDDMKGGFVQELSRAEPVGPIDRLPLYILPGILTSLGLPADEDVLEVFRSSASGWEEANARERKNADDKQEGGGVELKDFRAVCAALMGNEGDGQNDEDLQGDDEEADQAFEIESSSSLSTLSDSDDEYGQPSVSSKGKGKGKGKASAGPGASLRRGKQKANMDLEEDQPIKLTSGQKEMVKSLWEMVKPNASGRGANILGRDEVKDLARGLSEMWSDEEITEMVSLFSTQHEGRGLSYDDFGKVMYRAGLV
ncbi:hypothetical protein BD324DRAFT_605359 [Kockovaella imperatae]|uniref:EF-hand domain-containing protein n=1 Tax=Kockovaella imperatae TaxID=4999 RepID=A0A1Y1U7H9_9TREE|nr:hypothetical protein BD324DRAFT_605359 [Kockovaella imperatae]ORX33991.1 hypothetical protein BD324DRAFT_605359 [Kockovaella imperatae]